MPSKRSIRHQLMMTAAIGQQKIVTKTTSTKQRRKAYRGSRRLVIQREIPPPILEKDENYTTSPPPSSAQSTMDTNSSSNCTSSLDNTSSFFSSHDTEDASLSMGHRWQMESSDRVKMAESFKGQEVTSTSHTSHTGSTFEEVESLDFSGSRDLGDINFIINNLRRAHSSSSSGRKGSTSVSSMELNSESDRKEQAKIIRKRTKDLIVPDEEEEEPFPFAKHVFNKKEKKEKHGKHHNHHGYQRSHSSLFDQLIQYKLHHQVSESSQSTHSSSFNSAGSDSVRLPFESDYDYYLRTRYYSSCSSGPQSSVGGSVAGLSRTISLDSSSSSNVSSSSPDYTMSPPVIPSVTAEEVLMNLGFCGQGSFLPERFARDWCTKLLVAKQQMDQQVSLFSQFCSKREENSHQLGGKIQSKFKENKCDKRNAGSAADFLHKLDFNSRTSASTRRARLRRAATALSQPAVKQLENTDKQDSLDQLKYVLTKQASILQSGGNSDSKEKRRKAFATSRQKSLPIFLETLKEEDEQRLSRGPSIESPKKNKLKEFLEQDEQLSRSSSKDSDSSKEVISILSSKGCSKSSTATHSNASTDDEFGVSMNTNLDTTPLSNDAIDKDATITQQKIRPPLPTIIIPQKQLSHSSDAGKDSESVDINVPKCEPAMVSVVLSDTEEDRHGNKQYLNSNFLDLLSPSSLSVSPCPQSPVTVIEVDQLDNQNLDSTDSGDVADSPDDSVQSCENISPQMPELVIYEDKSLGNLMLNEDYILHHDCCTETDDRTLSPLSIMHFKSSSPQGSESAYESSEDDKIDESVQADDGSLSPILFSQQIIKTHDQYYVSDAQTQSITLEFLDKDIQTKQLQLVDVAVGDNEHVELDRSFSDFEPQYFMNEGCQTDKPQLTETKSNAQQTVENYTINAENNHCKNCLQSISMANIETYEDIKKEDENNDENTMSQPRKLSYIDIMEMFERSDSMPDYVERNVDLSKDEKLLDCLTISSVYNRCESMPENSHGSFDISPQLADGDEEEEEEDTVDIPVRNSDSDVIFAFSTKQEGETENSMLLGSSSSINYLPDINDNSFEISSNNRETFEGELDIPISFSERNEDFDKNLQGFDLDGLLKRIERIENMISSVTSVYSQNKVNVGQQCNLSQESSGQNAQTLSSDISSMITALNMLNKSLSHDERTKTPPDSSSLNLSDLMVDHLESQPKQKLTKTRSFEIGRTSKRPILNKRKSLQRQSNIEDVTLKQESKIKCSDQNFEFHSFNYNLSKRRFTDGLLQDLQSHPVLFEEEEFLEDEDKESIVSDVFEDDITPNDITSDKFEHSNVPLDKDVMHEKNIKEAEIDSEIARMREQLKVMSSQSSDYVGISLFETLNIEVSQLPTVPTSLSSITRGIIQDHKEYSSSKSNDMIYNRESKKNRKFSYCEKEDESISSENDENYLQDEKKSYKFESEKQIESEYLSSSVKNNVRQSICKTESSAAYSRLQNVLKDSLSAKISNSTNNSSKSQPIPSSYIHQKNNTTGSVDISKSIKYNNSIISSQSLENLPANLVSKSGKGKPKDINQFQALLMNYGCNNEKVVNIEMQNQSGATNSRLSDSNISDLICPAKQQSIVDVQKEKLAWDIADDIFGNIHEQLLNRTELLSDIEVDYTILKAVNHTMDKLLVDMNIDEDDMPLGWPEVQTSL